jgi:hypothetical protein
MSAHPRAVLVALCLLMYLPGLSALPPLDRDEFALHAGNKTDD